MYLRTVIKGGLLIVGLGFALPVLAGTLPDTMEKPDGFPARPLSAIVPYGPGGGSGQFGRALAEAVTRLTEVTINMEYKPGGSGAVGMTAYMAIPTDGYTVLEHIDDAASGHAMTPALPNPAEDLIPLVIAQITFSQIYIRSDETRYTDWDSFVAYAKAQDGKTTIANVSKAGSMERLNLKFVTDHVGIKLQQISFDKGGQRYGALKGAQVDALFEQPGDVRGFLDSGDFKPILTFLNSRPSVFADVPSLKDIGMDITPLMRYRGYYVHKDTPAERVKWLQWAFQKAFDDADYQAFNKKKFMDLIDSFRDTEGSKQLISDTIATYRKTYKELGLIK
jgi:tripartite-type tricarboxylate transporter receptor subunit TctC